MTSDTEDKGGAQRHYEVSWTTGAIHAHNPLDAAHEAADVMRGQDPREIDEFEVFDVDTRAGFVVDLITDAVRPAAPSRPGTHPAFGPRALELVVANPELSAGAITALYTFAVLWDGTGLPVTTDTIAHHARLLSRTVHRHLTQWTVLRRTADGWTPAP
ncbi:hypothetical protein ACFU7Y_41990 [Kitasatospora sp. NPDC057542]|uniref:hypothetical protein n=1 Tax=Kitasatospora sp. NPDC057542 TaxID=3346162 RepID=UPI0036867B83